MSLDEQLIIKHIQEMEANLNLDLNSLIANLIVSKKALVKKVLDREISLITLQKILEETDNLSGINQGGKDEV